MVARRFVVTVLKPDYSGVIGRLPYYSSCSATWQRMGISTASLYVPSEGEAALQMMQAYAYHVPVTLKADGFPRWTGYVSRVDDDGVPARQPDGTVRIAATQEVVLTGDREWLDRLLGAPTPGSSWSSQTTEHDTRTGPIDTVLRQYLTANINRVKAEGFDLPIVVTPAPPGDASPAVTIEVRNKSLREELEEAMREHGRDITVTLWLPGDEQPDGMALTIPTLVADVAVARALPHINFSDQVGGLSKRRLTVLRPKALAVSVGGPGEGAARVFTRVVADDGRVETMGPQGFAEEFLDATDADSGDLRIKRGREKLAELGGKVAVSVTIDDRRPWVAGPDKDYWVGDEARATFSGVSVTDYIDRITVTSNGEGFTVTSQFGATRETESADIRLARVVAADRAARLAEQARR